MLNPLSGGGLPVGASVKGSRKRLFYFLGIKNYSITFQFVIVQLAVEFVFNDVHQVFCKGSGTVFDDTKVFQCPHFGGMTEQICQLQS